MKDGQTYNPFQLFDGLFVPEWLARSKQISAGAKLAFGRLARYAGRNGLAYPAVDTLAEEIGYGVRQTQYFLIELQKAGLIRKVARVSEVGQTSNLYEFVWLDRLISGDSPGALECTPSLQAIAPPPVQAIAPKESHIEDSHLTHTQVVRVSPPRASDLNGQTSSRWEEFWGKYPRKQHKDMACRNFLSYVTLETEAAAFACLERYLRSAEVARGVVMNPDKWLLEQYNWQWEGDWPAKSKTLDEMIEERYADDK